MHVAPDDYAAGTLTAGVVATTGVGSTGSIEVSGDHDWYSVSLTAGVQYRFDEHGAHSSQGTLTDTVLALWDGAGTTQLASNDDINGAADRESEFFYTPATTGTYYVDAAAFGSNTGTYTVHVAPDDYAAGTWTAGHVSVGGSATGNIEVVGDRDWFSVSLTAGTSYVLREDGTGTGAGTLADSYMYLYDSSSTLLAQDDDSGPGLDSRLIFAPSSSGTYFIGAATFGSNTGTYTVSAAVLPVARDFNFDGHSDILWQDTDGQSAIWETSGTSVIGGGLAGANPGPSWLVKGSGDFNGDGYSDILWQDTGGPAAVWELNGTSLIGGGLTGANPGASWRVVESGDFNGDGYSDILWQDTSGQAAIWEMNGTSLISGGLAGANPGPSWQVIGAGDFNGDGKSDILWQDTSGQAAIWEMNGTNVIGGGLAGPDPGPSWPVKGAGDFNGDGYSDILWQNTSGQAAVWELNGTNVIGGGAIGGNPGPSWHLFAG